MEKSPLRGIRIWAASYRVVHDDDETLPATGNTHTFTGVPPGEHRISVQAIAGPPPPRAVFVHELTGSNLAVDATKKPQVQYRMRGLSVTERPAPRDQRQHTPMLRREHIRSLCCFRFDGSNLDLLTAYHHFVGISCTSSSGLG